ncbi:MAG TPA: response regulator [Planctomycetota bacterium]|jgi:CheY-like chemotaxis protein|nr:response regulator [Planctomycetota bacterium]
MHPPPQSDPVRVLLIEDDDDSAEITRRLLVRFGADVLVAASVADALTAAVKIRPELVLSDIFLPDGNGFELIPRLRDQMRDQLPAVAPFCVATSGVVGAMNDARSGAARFDRFLQKPVEPRLLQALVEDARGRRSAPLSA